MAGYSTLHKDSILYFTSDDPKPSERLKQYQVDSTAPYSIAMADDSESSKRCSSRDFMKRKGEMQRDESTAAKKSKTSSTDTNSTSTPSVYVNSMQTQSQMKQVYSGSAGSSGRKVHLCDKDVAGPAAASSVSKQKTFLELMGLVSIINIPDTDSELLDDNEANILATANQHTLIPTLKEYSQELIKNDGYYTQLTMENTFQKLLNDKGAPMCTCVAHQAISESSSSSDLAKEKYRQLIRLPSEVNDDQGKSLAVALIKRIFDHFKINDMTVTPTERGTNWNVDFVLLDIAASEMISHGFRGWGDFSICHQERNAGAEELLVAVGEVESQGKDTVAKLGIYSIGQFRKKSGVPKRYLPSVGIYKDKAAIICMAELTPPAEASESSSSATTARDLGRVSFKMVEGADRLNLKSVEGVKEFARRLIGTIRFAMDTEQRSDRS